MSDKNIDISIEDVAGENSIILRAMKFAIIAHRGQYRKSDSTTPYVLHPIKVANIVKQYSKNRNLIAAAYLHDVVEDSDCTYDDIEKYFGIEVKNFVKCASESDKSLSWETRKTETIEKVKKFDHEKKILIAADKLANITDLNEYFEKIGHHDFSKFNRGEDKQEWYYRNIYFSLITNDNPNFRLYEQLKDNINEVFDRNMSDYFETSNYQKKIVPKIEV